MILHYSVWPGLNRRHTHVLVDQLNSSAGQSNPTYFLTDARYVCVVFLVSPARRHHSELHHSRGLRFVLRKKPAGKLLSQTAHQVEREYTVLAAIHKHNSRPTTPPELRVPVPRVFVLCEDNEVIGTPFYIMEFLEGRIFTDMSMPGVSQEVRREWYVVNLISPTPPTHFHRHPQLALRGTRSRRTILARPEQSRPGKVRLAQAVFPTADQVSLESDARAGGREGYRERRAGRCDTWVGRARRVV